MGTLMQILVVIVVCMLCQSCDVLLQILNIADQYLLERGSCNKSLVMSSSAADTGDHHSSSSSRPNSTCSDSSGARNARKPTADDFKFGKIIGEGSFSTVGYHSLTIFSLLKSVCKKKPSFSSIFFQVYLVKEISTDKTFAGMNCGIILASFNSTKCCMLACSKSTSKAAND